MINGVTQNLTVLNYNPPYNTSINFRIENVGGREIFRYVVDNQSSPIGYSPTMPFNGGYPVTDSEHRLSCDSLWTDISGLQEQTNYNPVTWSTNYSDLECWRNDSDDWYLHKLSSSESQVNQTYGGWGYNCQKIS